MEVQMLLRKESAYAPISPGRYLPYWRRIIDSLHRQLKLSKDRYLNSDQSATPSVTFIRIILDAFNFATMDMSDDFDLYYGTIVPQSDMVNKKFYPLVNVPYLNRFTDKPIKELVLPTSGIVDNATISLIDDWDVWSTVKPFRLINIDSMEFNLPEDTLKFRFTKDKPRYITFCIDVPALVMMFIKYVKDSGSSFEEVDIDNFIKLHVLSNIYDDYVDCWLMNLLSACLTDEDDAIDKLIDFSKYNQYVGISSLNIAYQEIRDLVERIGDDKIRLSAILSSELFSETTLLDVMKLHEKSMVVGKDNRTIGFELIKSSVLLEILVNVIELQPDKTTKIRSQFSLEYGMMRRSNWKSHVLDKELRSIAGMVESTLVLAT